MLHFSPAGRAFFTGGTVTFNQRVVYSHVCSWHQAKVNHEETPARRRRELFVTMESDLFLSHLEFVHSSCSTGRYVETT